jgi:chemotaxis protein methyltransferase WspC
VTSAFDTTRLAALAQVRVPNVGGRLPAGAAGESLAHVRLAATVDVSGSAPGRTPAAAFAPRTVSVPPAASAAPAPAPLGRGPLARNLDEAHTLADAGNLDAAAVAARAYLAAHPSSASAYYLLGLIADARGVTPEARTHYKRALYLDPAHREALTHLAAVLELDGDEAGARLLLARADRVVKHGGRDE